MVRRAELPGARTPFCWTPLQALCVSLYLRGSGLLKVHEGLRGADPASMSVADVARRWGFVRMGGFAMSCRPAFGEAPSQTPAR